MADQILSREESFTLNGQEYKVDVGAPVNNSNIDLSNAQAELACGALLLVYALYRRDPVFIAGQAFGVFVYARNLHFELRDRRKERARASRT
jgi:hypothetical protein